MSSITVQVSQFREVVALGDQFIGRGLAGGAGMLRVVGQNGILQVSSLGGAKQMLRQSLQCETSGLFEALIPPKRLNQILQSVRDETVTISTLKGSVRIKGASSMFTLSTEEFDTFPDVDFLVPDYSEVQIPASVMSTSLQHTLPICDDTSTRFALGGVMLEMSDQGTVFIATDSRRMLVSRRPDIKLSGIPAKFILPSQVGKSLLSLLKRQSSQTELKVTMNQSKMVVCGESFEVVMAAVEGRFPEWRGLMAAQDGPRVMFASAGDLKRSCRLANVMTTEEHRGVAFRIKDTAVELDSPSELGQCSVALKADGTEDFLTELVAQYVLDAVAGFQDHEMIDWRQKDGDSALYLHLPDDMVCCIMPLSKDA
jgi:DNA polymerase-3 subunit beta